MKKSLLRTFVIFLFIIMSATFIHKPSGFPLRSPVTNKFFSYKKYLRIFRSEKSLFLNALNSKNEMHTANLSALRFQLCSAPYYKPSVFSAFQSFRPEA
jgi:hypothetical protein